MNKNKKILSVIIYIFLYLLEQTDRQNGKKNVQIW